MKCSECDKEVIFEIEHCLDHASKEEKISLKDYVTNNFKNFIKDSSTEELEKMSSTIEQWLDVNNPNKE